MDPTTFQALQGAAGASSADPLYVDDLFGLNTFQNDGSIDVNNDIDLAGEGGLVVGKYRTSSSEWGWIDSAQGTSKALDSSSTSGPATEAWVTSFDNNGWTGGNYWGTSSDDCFSWTYRKQAGFFDIVTYTSQTGVTAINHSLGSVPGCIMVKNLSQGTSWQVYHRSLGAGKELELDGASGERTNNCFPSTPTSTQFFINAANNAVFGNVGDNFVAYIFAHDDQSFGENGDQSIIKCGTITSDGSGYRQEDLGWEPQFLMLKRTSGSGDDWLIFDIMRGWPMRGDTSETYTRALRYNSPNQESNYQYVYPWYSGFEIDESSLGSHTWVYMAIRRPFKPITDPTKLFQAKQFSGIGATNWEVTNFPVDMLHTNRRNGGTPYIMSRMQGPLRYFNTNGTSTEGHGAGVIDFGSDALKLDNSGAGSGAGDSYIHLYFRRAPGFFDVVPYIGNASARTIPHQLGTTPSVVILKNRNNQYNTYWQHYQAGASNWFELSSSSTVNSSNAVFNGTHPTSTVFSVGNGDAVNKQDAYCIAYLFADMPGVLKASTYSGSGSNLAIDINCGFTNGARFVLIKRTNATGGWYYYDTTRGINVGNDPYMFINNGNSQVTNTDYIDPLNSGFTVAAGSSPDANPLNVSGGTYIYLAIA